jgi:hypothetical protein
MAIISGCDASPVFQLAEHALDNIPAPIGLVIERVWDPSGSGCRGIGFFMLSNVVFHES